MSRIETAGRLTVPEESSGKQLPQSLDSVKQSRRTVCAQLSTEFGVIDNSYPSSPKLAITVKDELDIARDCRVATTNPGDTHRLLLLNIM